MYKHRVLVVDDDGELRRTFAEALEQKNFDVVQAADGLEAIESIKKERCDFVMLDVNMPRMNGIEALKKIKELDPSIIVIIMTAFSNIEDAVVAIKEGAYNYLAKPIKHQTITEMVERGLKAQQMVHSMAFSAPVVKLENTEFVGGCNEMQKLFGIIYKLAKVDTSVLIRGESGTGKELVARAIHFNSSRKDDKFVAINCSSIPETLFESEVFGHEKGAFTGAHQRQIGKLQYAGGGTVFLDEIGDLPLPMQVKLLRVLQEKKFTPVGATREIDLHARIIAATNRDLEAMIKEGTFREDLFYRLNVIPIFLPALKDRKGDLQKLVQHFIQKFNAQHGKNIKGLSPDAAKIIDRHSWPGNIRELENVMEHAFVIESTEVINVGSLPEQLLSTVGIRTTPSPTAQAPSTETTAEIEISGGQLDYRAHKEQFEKEFIIKALKQFNGRINQTALQANIPKKTLLRKLQKYNIRPDDYRA